MRIQHNIAAMNAYRNYNINTSAVAKNLEKLSSGYKINRAGDDAAGLAISEKMRAQITGLETAQKNAKDGISLVKTAEGALQEVHDMLNRMVTLATQSANGTYDNETDRAQLQKEMDQLRTEINRIADSANFNGIKLFDGSLSGADITTTGLETSQIDMAKGVEVVQGTNGGGSKGEFTINVDAAFGTGDKLEIVFGGDIATANAGLFATTAGTAELNFGAEIKGNTREEQAKSIAAALGKDANIIKHFDVERNGTAVTLRAKIEGNKTAATAAGDKDVTSTVTSIKVTDKQNLDRTWSVATADKAADGTLTSAKVKIEGLFDNATGKGLDIKTGDELKLSFKLNDGTELSASLVYGTDFERGDTPEDTLDNFITALGSVSLNDNEDTLLDESKLKLSDIMTVAKESNKNLEFTAVDGAVDWDAVGDIKITNVTTGREVASTTAGANATTPKGDKVTLDLTAGTTEGALPTTVPATTAAVNLTIEDKLTFNGKLADGRTFEFTIEAGKDFKVDDATFSHASSASTMKNVKELLESDDFKIKLSDGTEVKGSDIFGNNAEIKITLGATTSFESVRPGTHTGTSLTSVKLTAGDKTAASANLKNGDQQTSADSTITLSEGVSYGSIVEVGGKKYELVKTAGDVSNAQNKAVIVGDINDLDAAARSLASSIKEDLNSTNYKVTASNGKVTVATTKIGSTAQAVSASALGDKTTQVEFTLDPKKMKAGSTVTINGQTYEFVNKGDNASKKEYIGLEVSNFAKETSSTLGSALAKAANGQKNASVTMDENGKVTVRGLVDSETKQIVTPTVKFDGGTSGLRLQIGDTAEDFNQMNVSIYNMHCADMGIGDISIADQDSAAAAIDAIRGAINYVSDVRGTLGATQNRLDHTINNLSVMQENIQDAESTIRDTDIAEEMMAYTKNNILVQSAQAMLAQANQIPQGVLQLLG